MRLFLSVHPGDRFRDMLSTGLDRWRDQLHLRWTHPDTWHVTLQFLGEWPENRMHGLMDALDREWGVEVFDLSFPGTGVFPTRGAPRVLILQADGCPQLPILAGEARSRADAAWPDGPQDRRPFRGHMTLGRIRHRLPCEQVKLLRGIDLGELPQVLVEEVDLVHSTLTASGPRYRILKKIPLRKKGE